MLRVVRIAIARGRGVLPGESSFEVERGPQTECGYPADVVSNAGPLIGDARTSFAVRRIKGINLQDAHNLVMDGVVEIDR